MVGCRPSRCISASWSYRALITSGELVAGAKLPTQAEIAAEWECSLAPVRQALSLLEQEGLVESYQGRGVYVLAQPGRPARRAR
jgi:DNA-binding GntR family transcriptional regulator